MHIWHLIVHFRGRERPMYENIVLEAHTNTYLITQRREPSQRKVSGWKVVENMPYIARPSKSGFDPAPQISNIFYQDRVRFSLADTNILCPSRSGGEKKPTNSLSGSPPSSCMFSFRIMLDQDQWRIWLWSHHTFFIVLHQRTEIMIIFLFRHKKIPHSS